MVWLRIDQVSLISCKDLVYGDKIVQMYKMEPKVNAIINVNKTIEMDRITIRSIMIKGDNKGNNNP